MKINFTLGYKEEIEIQLNRNQFTGKFTYTENGQVKMLRNPIDKDTHFPSDYTAYYRFTVGDKEKFDIRVVHTWSERFPAFKPQTYEIYVNGDLVKTVTSY
jgi:hypothetical protein